MAELKELTKEERIVKLLKEDGWEEDIFCTPMRIFDKGPDKVCVITKTPSGKPCALWFNDSEELYCTSLALQIANIEESPAGKRVGFLDGA